MYQLDFRLLIRVSHSASVFMKKHSINEESRYKPRDTAKRNIVSRRETVDFFILTQY